jgi:hypothetical protein
LMGPQMERFTAICICVQQLVCTVFLSFVGVNFQAVVESILGVYVGHVTVITLALPSVMALTVGLPDLKALDPVTLVGRALLLSSRSWKHPSSPWSAGGGFFVYLAAAETKAHKSPSVQPPCGSIHLRQVHQMANGHHEGGLVPDSADEAENCNHQSSTHSRNSNTDADFSSSAYSSSSSETMKARAVMVLFTYMAARRVIMVFCLAPNSIDIAGCLQ